MNLLPGTQNITTTSDIAVGTSGKAIRVFCITLVSGGTASTLILRNGATASSTPYEQIDGSASLSVTKNYAGGMRFPNGCFADTDTNISYATVVYAEEL